MGPKDVIRYHRHDTPSYLIFVNHQPNLGRHKQQYIQAVRCEARKRIDTPIAANDIEVEIIYSTSISEGSRADVDNITKPTLDALVGVGFNDDRQVRSVTSTLFDKNRISVVDGRVEYMGQLFFTEDKHMVLICVYSDTRLNELGGEEAVRKKRREEFLSKHESNEQMGKKKWWQLWKDLMTAKQWDVAAPRYTLAADPQR